MEERTVAAGGVALALEESGDPQGPPVVLLHGLTGTRRYVVMGSNTLARRGFRVIAYDARGHGASSPAPDREGYRYVNLTGDLAAVMDELGIERTALAGVSMGSHTILRFALDRPERVAALVVITPGYDPGAVAEEARLARWDRLAAGLRAGGVEGFLAAYGEPPVPERWRATLLKVLRQRLARHEHPEAVADALEVVPRSRPFGTLDDLRAIAAPTIVVASHDEADPLHPYALGEAYAAAIPGARLVSEEPGRSPLAWQGGQLSRLIAEAASGS